MTRGAWIRLWLAWMVVGSSACEPTLDGPIDYHWTGGWGGRGPEIHIELDGLATRSHWCGTPVTVQLDMAVLADLRQETEGARLTTLESTYLRCKDCDHETVSAQLGGRVYRVAVSNMARDVPSRLRALLAKLRALASDGPKQSSECDPAIAGGAIGPSL